MANFRYWRKMTWALVLWSAEPKSGKLQGLQCLSGAFTPRNAAEAKRVGDVGGGGPAKQHRLLEDHGLAPPDLVIHRRVAPKNEALGWLDEAVHQSKQ